MQVDTPAIEWRQKRGSQEVFWAPIPEIRVVINLHDYVVDRFDGEICSWTWSIYFLRKGAGGVLCDCITGSGDEGRSVKVFSDIEAAQQSAVAAFLSLKSLLKERVDGMKYWVPVLESAIEFLD